MWEIISLQLWIIILDNYRLAQWVFPVVTVLTHWGRVTHICVSKLTTIGSDNGLSPGRRQAIIWTNDGILLIRTLGTNFSEILSEIQSFSFKKMHLKMSSAKWRLFRLGLNELKAQSRVLRWRSKAVYCIYIVVIRVIWVSKLITYMYFKGL